LRQSHPDDHFAFFGEFDGVACKVKDDLAQVESVDTAQNIVTLKMIPRIDLTKKRGAQKEPDDKLDPKKRKRRPAQKLFDTDTIRSLGGQVTKERETDMWFFEGNRYSQKGFLIKNFPMVALITEGVKPTLIELQRFEDSGSGNSVESKWEFRLLFCF
jgi:transcription elongation factor SPT5